MAARKTSPPSLPPQELLARQYARFVARVASLPKTNAGCIEWRGAHHEDGYGLYKLRPRGLVGAHRIIWTIKKGQIPAGMMVCHTCDNPPCVNIEHLWLGTQKDNIQDAVRKGRMSCGSMNGQAVLSESQVAVILARCASGDTRTAIARTFHVSPSAISLIARRRAWRHVHV